MSLPFILGTSSFSWTCDQKMSFTILDDFVSSGGVFLDTADMYGLSEEWIGLWIKANTQSKLKVFSKVGAKPNTNNLSRKNVLSSALQSCALLKVDFLDVYFIHADDEAQDIRQLFDSFHDLVQKQLIQTAGVSNIKPARLRELLEYQREVGVEVFRYFQTPLNLLQQQDFKNNYLEIIKEYEIQTMSYYSLAKGFLSGNYNLFTPKAKWLSAHGGIGVDQHRNFKDLCILGVMKFLSGKYKCSIQEIALSWLNDFETIFLPIVGVSNDFQLKKLLKKVEISEFDRALLNRVSVGK
jgi:aryl-alcohol dehydrogenase-like predicted oxidoreductase